MHYLVMPLGSAGDVHPFAGLALELKRRGHSVTLATNGYFEGLAAKFGLDFIEIGDSSAFHEGINNPDLWHPFRSFPYLYRNMIEPTVRPQFDIVAAETSKRPTTVLCNCFGFGALNAQDKLGAKVISIHLQPVMLWSRIKPPRMPGLFGPKWLQHHMYKIAQRLVIDPVVLPSLNAFRRELEMPPIKHVMDWWHSKKLLLCLFPDWFCPSQPDWPGPNAQVDFPLWDERQHGQIAFADGLGDIVDPFLNHGTAPIAFTPGSANIFGNDFFEIAVQACKRLERRAIFLTRFAKQLPADLPNWILHVPYAPLSLLLPRCSAFVHHGGIGSASQAMAAGVPQLIRPQAHDQFDNAMRIVEHGIGDFLKPRQFTADALASKLKKILESDMVSKNCMKVAERIVPSRGVNQAADRIEALE
jgi:rhamnosyltransferase subunit B